MGVSTSLYLKADIPGVTDASESRCHLLERLYQLDVLLRPDREPELTPEEWGGLNAERQRVLGRLGWVPNTGHRP